MKDPNTGSDWAGLTRTLKFTSTTGNVMEGWRRSRLALGAWTQTCDFTGSGRGMLDHSKWYRFTVLVDFVCDQTRL